MIDSPLRQSGLAEAPLAAPGCVAPRGLRGVGGAALKWRPGVGGELRGFVKSAGFFRFVQPRYASPGKMGTEFMFNVFIFNTFLLNVFTFNTFTFNTFIFNVTTAASCRLDAFIRFVRFRAHPVRC